MPAPLPGERPLTSDEVERILSTLRREFHPVPPPPYQYYGYSTYRSSSVTPNAGEFHPVPPLRPASEYGFDPFLDNPNEETPMTPPKAKRTLLHLVKKYKSKPDHYNKNYKAYFWAWLYQKIFELADQRVTAARQVVLSRYARECTIDYHIRTIKEAVGKAMGTELVKIQVGNTKYWYSREGTTAVWNPDGETFVYYPYGYFTPEMLTADYTWIEEIKAYVATYRLLPCRTTSNNEQGYTTYLAWRYQDVATCPCCRTEWKAKDFRLHYKTFEKVCPLCVNKPVENERPVPTTVYGGYHSHRGHWKFLIKKHRHENSLPMGIELEVQSKQGYNDQWAPTNAWSIYQAEQKANPKWHEIYFERDGSLHNGGFEIVSNPMTLEMHREFWTAVMPAVAGVSFGYKWQDMKNSKNYGIHITFDSGRWRNVPFGRFLKFMNNMHNMIFLQAIAQRRVVYNGGIIAGETKRLKDISFIQRDGKWLPTDKYKSVHLKGDGLCEIRIFASTTKLASFMKNLEFVDAMYHWCHESPVSLDHLEFIKWIQNNHKDRWLNLIGFLARRRHPMTADPTELQSTWLHYIDHSKIPNRQSVFPDDIPYTQTDE